MSQGFTGVHTHTISQYFLFGTPGDAVVTTGGNRLYLQEDIKIIEVEVSVGTAPIGAALIVDVNVNDVTIFTTQSNRPEIAVSTFVDSSTTIQDASHTNGQYITVDIDQIGSTSPGVDVSVVVRYEKT
jgi:hypothetical protein